MGFSAVAERDGFDPVACLEELLAPLGLSTADTGGEVTFAGQDPIVPDRIRLGAAIGVPMMAAAVGAAALHRIRSGIGQDLRLDLRQAIHHVTPHAFWHPTLAGELPEHSLIFDNPFLLDSYRTRDGRTVMASGVYPHLAAKWCRFLDVPPDRDKVAAAFAKWDAFALEEAANAVGLPLCVARTAQEWAAHPQGALLASQPVIGLERIGPAPVKKFSASDRPLDGVRVLSFTHAVAGPTVGRTMAEQGADVLCATRANDYEHAFIYTQANIGSRSTLLDLNSDNGRRLAEELLAEADVVVNNHRGDKLERLGLAPDELAKRHPGLVQVSVTCYGSQGPWAARGGFDMNGSAASGLMAAAGSEQEPRLPVTGMINDFVTGYMGAVGATAGLVKRATVGGSWRVTVNLTRNAMWYLTLGLVDPALAGRDEEHSLREPKVFDADTPLGALHFPAPQVEFGRTLPAWPDPALVPRGSSSPRWR
jgi:crotonobetainyl-CoA:carnitine CoA-transferase CaiB-like acyl-CoA transferase